MGPHEFSLSGRASLFVKKHDRENWFSADPVCVIEVLAF